MLNQQEFDHLKKLCRIDCSGAEESNILDSLQKLLDYFEQLQEVNTEGVAACNYVLQAMLKNQMREDAVKDLLPREKFLNNAPDQIGGMVRVPPVLKT